MDGTKKKLRGTTTVNIDLILTPLNYMTLFYIEFTQMHMELLFTQTIVLQKILQ